jgi:hypothetical protein
MRVIQLNAAPGATAAKLATASFTPVGNEADLIWWHEPHETP